jgi:hypothetical protein
MKNQVTDSSFFNFKITLAKNKIDNFNKHNVHMYLIFDIFDNYFEIVQFTHSNNISTTGNDVMSASTKNVLISFWIMLICGCVTLTCTCMLRKKHLKKQSESCWNQSLGFSITCVIRKKRFCH